MVSSIMQFTRIVLRIMSFVASVSVTINAKILVGPRDTEAAIEETVEFHCTGTSVLIEWHHLAMGSRYPKLVYQDGFIYNGYKERFQATRTNDGKCNLIINGVNPMDAGKYICLENSATPLQTSAELIVFERFPSNESCVGRYACNPICNDLELSCEMKVHGNYIPSMQWIDHGGKYIDSANKVVNGTVASTVKLKSDPHEAVLYTCRLHYHKIPLTSKYNWTYSTSEWESFSKVINPGQQSPAKPAIPSVKLILITACTMIAIFSAVWIAYVLIRRRKIKNKQRLTKLISENSRLLIEKTIDENGIVAKAKFQPWTAEHKNNPVHSIAAIDNEYFTATRFTCMVEVFDLPGGGWKRSWPVPGLISPFDMAACPVKKIIFICDGMRTSYTREVLSLDIDGNLLCRWSSLLARGCMSITRESHVIMTAIWDDTIKEFTSNIQEYTSTGILVKTIQTENNGLHLRHAVKFVNGNFVASFGDGKNDHQEICILNEEGQILNSLKRESILTLEAPRSLAVDRKGNIYICDLHNFQIIVLNPELKFKRFLDTTSEGYELKDPLRICVHEVSDEGWLLVADSGKRDKKWKIGRVAIWNLQDISTESVSYSRLLYRRCHGNTSYVQ